MIDTQMALHKQLVKAIESAVGENVLRDFLFSEYKIDLCVRDAFFFFFLTAADNIWETI